MTRRRLPVALPTYNPDDSHAGCQAVSPRRLGIRGEGRRLPDAGLQEVLDGELAVFDKQLRSRFDWLRHQQRSELATPPVLIAFDVLYVNGRDLFKRPLRDRRPRLEDLLRDVDLVLNRTPNLGVSRGS